MKLQEHDYGFEAVLPENRTPFKIKTSAKLFDILSSGIYKDKILAVIRELSCNAYDAHVVAGKKHVPFKLRLPTRLDPTFYVEDEGTGIDPERITDIYWTYGESSKTDSNDQIGALGLGSKSPFAYTKSSFVVKNRYQGVEHTYLCFINENGMPDGSKLDESPTDKPSGVTVEFAVRPEDITAFYDRTDRFFKRWNAVKPVFVDQDEKEVLRTKIKRVIEGTDWYLEKTDRNAYSDHQGAVALQGNVPYPIEASSIPKLPSELAIIAGNPFIITFQMGEVNFASSREALQYDERTCTNIISRLQEVSNEMKASFSKKIFKKGMTQLQFIANFGSTFREFQNTVNVKAGWGTDSYNAYLKLLLGLTKRDTVKYDCHSYEIGDLLSKSINLVSKKFQSFGVYCAARRGSRGRLWKFGSLKFFPKHDIQGNLIHPTWTATAMLKVGDPLHFEWNNPVQPKRAETNDFYRACAIIDQFDVETHYELPIHSETLTFYVNDTGSAGEGRYRALVERQGFTTSFFVNFDAKTHKVEDIITELDTLIQAGLKGATIKRLSAEPDHRAPIEKEKIESGSARLRTRTFVLASKETKHTVPSGNGTVKAREIYRTVAAEKIMKLADLQALPVVPYIIKQRSATKLYDEPNRETIIGDNIFTTLSIHYLLSDLIVEVPGKTPGDDPVSTIQVLVLNEGQINRLKSKKVKLVGMKALIAERIKAKNDAEKFAEKIERVMALKKVRLITDLYSSLTEYGAGKSHLKARMMDDTVVSPIKALFREYSDALLNEALLNEHYAKNYVMAEAGHVGNQASSIANDLDESLESRYRILKLISNIRFLNSEDLEEVIGYIEQIDQV